MHELFFHTLRTKAGFNDQDLEVIRTHLTPKKLRKKQYLLQEGDPCKYVTFVEKGLLRAYSIDEKGSEYIIQFALEGWLISDLYSFLTGEPATYTIDAVEDSELTLISRNAHEELLRALPKYETWIRMEITAAYLALQRRLTAVISLTLEERYEGFTSLYPDIVQRVPQWMIASYMGLTPETLSRVRKKITERK
ncbi:Crp/Fnr family transcriptional regulator [Flavihumibacter solisilvae]|uniref:Cyclic nucleotide-binding protein n=1 Tax=Flavihumibacter solisilvae TaxID=1349421 RepID=A0A0C1L491_9BACT|nr:Crp/Fnr family transcriptional regulator [Flavihumibacter solisilvae]KIC94411.1 cyclic nucleotide-binding protein [Flavihumibacter solisilvae]